MAMTKDQDRGRFCHSFLEPLGAFRLPSSKRPAQSRRKTRTMARVFSAWYLRKLEQSPILTKCASSFVVLTLGDVLAQRIEKKRAEKTITGSGTPGHDNRWEVLGIQWDRTLRMGAMGALYVAPVLHVYFRTMDKRLMAPNSPIMRGLKSMSARWMGRKSVSPTVVASAKLLIDQTVFAPFIISSVFVVSGTINGKSWSQIKAMFPDQFLQALKANYFVWPFVNFVTFRFVSENLRVVFSNSASVGWNCYLSSLIHDPSDDHNDSS